MQARCMQARCVCVCAMYLFAVVHSKGEEGRDGHVSDRRDQTETILRPLVAVELPDGHQVTRIPNARALGRERRVQVPGTV